MSRLPARFRLSALGLALLAAVAVLHALDLPAYMWLTRLTDGAAKPHPFVDLRAILQGGACWRQGVDVYRPSACLGGGVFNYSPVLLRLAYLPFGPADTLPLGLGFCAAFLAALALLPPPASRGEAWLRAAASFSPASFYALEQGNLDTLIFAAAIFAVWRLACPGPARPLAYALFAAAAAAKFYPAALFTLALSESRRTRLALGLAGLAGLVLALALFGHGILAALVLIPSGTPFRATFGRIDLARGLAMLHHLPMPADAASWGMTLVALAAAWPRRRVWASTLPCLAPGMLLFLIASAATTLFCFLAAQNVEYRALFLLPALPALARLGRWGLGGIIAALMWEALPRALISGLAQPYLPSPPAFALWLLREALWWGLAIELAALLLAFVAACRAGQIDASPQSP